MLAVVIPCYNEAKRLSEETLISFCDQAKTMHLYLVDDGSTDETKTVISKICAKRPETIFPHFLNPNAGKAEAVRRGIQHVLSKKQYEYVAFWDADFSTPLEILPLFYEKFQGEPDLEMLMGSRVKLLGADIQRKPIRHYLGRVFATAASLVLKLSVYDTQCGAKMFRATPILENVLKEPFLSRWIFDVELIARFLKEHSSNENPEKWIHEFPLPVWRDIDGSKVKPLDFLRAFWELICIYIRYS